MEVYPPLFWVQGDSFSLNYRQTIPIHRLSSFPDRDRAGVSSPIGGRKPLAMVIGKVIVTIPCSCSINLKFDGNRITGKSNVAHSLTDTAGKYVDRCGRLTNPASSYNTGI